MDAVDTLCRTDAPKVANKRAIRDGLQHNCRSQGRISERKAAHDWDSAQQDTVRPWDDSLAVTLSGVWNKLQASISVIREHGRRGSIVITSSSAGIRPTSPDLTSGPGGYVAAKIGVTGLTKTFALALATDPIRVTTVHPAGIDTPTVVNDSSVEYMRAHPEIAAASQNPLPLQLLGPRDVSAVVTLLPSDDARWVTGLEYRVNARLCTWPHQPSTPGKGKPS